MLPTDANDGFSTLYETFHDTVPSIDRIRVLGCDAFVLDQPVTSTGVQHTAKRGTFIGYDEDSPMYRVYLWDSHKVVISGNVNFNEESNLNKNVHSNPCLLSTND